MEISANVSFQSPAKTVTINGAVKITGAVDATYGFFKLADGAELTVAKLDDGKVVATFGEKAFYLCLSLEQIVIENPGFDMDSLKDAIVYQAAIDDQGMVYPIPRIDAEGYDEELYGKVNLADGEWTKIGPVGSMTMEKSGCHFFQIRLERIVRD